MGANGNLPTLRQCVAESKQLLAAGESEIRQLHDSGSSGNQVTRRHTEVVDSVILKIWDAALAESPAADQVRQYAALVAHSGYGRCDLAPRSDVDLLLLHHPRIERHIGDVAKRILSDGSDAGLNLGFSVRTPRQALQLARREPIILTAQIEARLLAGNPPLFDRFKTRFGTHTQRRWRQYLKSVVDARRTERAQFGETVFLLEPNIKKSRGGLRDIHLLRWAAYIRYGMASPDQLLSLGLLSPADHRVIVDAREFLLRLRNEMHLHGNRPYDVLFRAEQQRVSDKWDYPSSDSVLSVERFMSEYFRHTSSVRETVGQFLSAARYRDFLNPMISPLVSRKRSGFLSGPFRVGVSRQDRQQLKGNLTQVLRLMDFANQSGKRIDHATWTAIREDMMSETKVQVTDDAAEHFVSLLNVPTELGRLLRRLHEVGALDQLIVGMAHARSLLQFNRYHKYTVDEHSLRAVERATEFQTLEGPLGKAYRSIKDLSTLHLALLVHDLGKGLPGDHSEVGAQLAAQTAEALRLPKRRTAILVFLVRQHLLMSHLAFRRDTSDETTMIQFATEVGSPEHLKMLFVLTAADLAAVGPDVLNPWKVEILSEVYQRAKSHIQGADNDPDSVASRSDDLRQFVQLHVPPEHQEWFEQHMDVVSPTYLAENTAETIVADLDRLRTAPDGQPRAWGRYLPERQVSEYAVGLQDPQQLGIFHRATGALTSQGLQILSASIHTLADGYILDRFCVEDPDFEAEPPEDRIAEVCKALVTAVGPRGGSDHQMPVFRPRWQASANHPTSATERLPTRIVIDNNTLPDRTIIDIFTHDRPGLLYAMTRTLFRLNFSVQYAKIGTYLDQVVDVFYVTELNGDKTSDENRLESLEVEMLAAIESVSSDGPS